jgi:hypothetical protein
MAKCMQKLRLDTLGWPLVEFAQATEGAASLHASG